jgi:hypothetical protein
MVRRRAPTISNIASLSLNSIFTPLFSNIFWDEFISNDRMLIEAVLDEFKTRWTIPRFYVFVCAGDFAQVSFLLESIGIM